MGRTEDERGENPTVVERPASSQRTASATRPPSDALAEVLKPTQSRMHWLTTAGQGGFGSIEVVIDSLLQRRLAMKVVHSELSRDELTLQLFAREAMITAQLDHPNIVPVHDVGSDKTGRLYFTMKLVEGRSLSQIMAAHEGPLDWDGLRDRIEIAIKLCDALSFSHSRGVLHCDVKSGNVMVGDFGQVYLMDWGVAKLMEGSAVRIEGPLRDAAGLDELKIPHDGADSACVLGTPAYMSPEQATGQRGALDARTDVFSLGALLYEMITGRTPYADATSELVLASARGGAIEPPSTRATNAVPPELERIVMKALATDRDARYPSIDAMRDALVAFARGDSGFPKHSYAADELIIREGDHGDATYIVVSGRCEVFQTIDGARRTLRHMGPGEVFGEAAVLSEGPRTASVVACEPTTLLVIDRASLDEEVGTLKPWLARVLRTLAARFRDSESARVSAETHNLSDRDERIDD